MTKVYAVFLFIIATNSVHYLQKPALHSLAVVIAASNYGGLPILDLLFQKLLRNLPTFLWKIYTLTSVFVPN
jgi:hypothetical protein